MSTRRDKRKQKFKARRRPRATLLNLVSLMDIFTILVFFLLVNASTAEVLPSPKNIVLPEAGADKLPALNLVIAVDDRMIRLQGKPVVAVSDVLEDGKSSIRPLYDALLEAHRTTA